MKLDFDDAKSVFQDRSTVDLLRSYAVFTACTIRPLVKNSGKLVAVSNEVLGKQLTAWVMKQTFFRQFVAGEDAQTIKPTLARLRAAGVGGILDYAAENDVAQHQVEGKVTAAPRIMPAAAPNSPSVPGRGASRSFSASAAPARAPSRKGELDGNLAETVAGLATAKEEGGYAAVKVTALAQPELLQRVSETLEGQRRSFRALVAASSGMADPGQASIGRPGLYLDTKLDVEQFARGMAAFGKLYGVKVPLPDPSSLFTLLDVDCDGRVDYHDWSAAMALIQGVPQGVLQGGAREGADLAEQAASLAGFPSSVALQDALGLLSPAFRPEMARALPGEQPSLDRVEREEWADVMARADSLASAARGHGVTIMVDAEQTYLQPAIEAVGQSAMRRYNRPGPGKWRMPEVEHIARLAQGQAGTARWPYNEPSTAALTNSRHSQSSDPVFPVVYNTYQAYRRDCPSVLALAVAKADREQYLFGAKVVRGAYMLQERSRAAELGYNDPIHPSLAATHECFHTCVDMVIKGTVAQGRGEVMVASHNEASVAHVVATMAGLGLDPRTCGVSFGQLLGMCDFVTLSLGRAGYRAYKYVPYGPVLGVLPYLIRRAQENSDLLSGGVAKELRLLRQELGRRAGLGQ